jgi:SH3 domain protein
MYIGDNLRVGVRPEPGTNTAPTQVITSGALITILQKSSDYVRIRTEDGVEGWIRDDYISETPPARTRLDEMEKARNKAQQELAIANNSIQAQNQKIQLLNNEIYTLHQKLATLRPGSSKMWIYMIIATLSLCGLTFTLGILWNKQQVAKKLGGHTL